MHLDTPNHLFVLSPVPTLFLLLSLLFAVFRWGYICIKAIIGIVTCPTFVLLGYMCSTLAGCRTSKDQNNEWTNTTVTTLYYLHTISIEFYWYMLCPYIALSILCLVLPFATLFIMVINVNNKTTNNHATLHIHSYHWICWNVILNLSGYTLELSCITSVSYDCSDEYPAATAHIINMHRKGE